MGAGKMKYADRLEPLSQVIEIPAPALNEKLVPMNDNSKLTMMSRENLQAASILARRDFIKPRSRVGLSVIIAGSFCFAALAMLVALLLR
jgi:hypothetical protein